MSATGNIGRNSNGSDEIYLLQGLVEEKKLETWQSYFCELTNIFACCVDAEGTPLTQFGGNPDEKARVLKAIDKDQLRNMLFRVSESTLEDQAIEETAYPNLRLAVVTVKTDGKPIISWLLCGVLSDVSGEGEYPNPPLLGFKSTITEKDFDEVVDAVRDISTELFSYKVAIRGAEAESRRSRYSEKKMKATLKRTEALTEIIQLLENDDSVEKIMLKMLETAGNFLNISTASVCRVLKDADYMDIVAHWCNKGEVWRYEGNMKVKRAFFLQTQKALVISDSSSLKTEEREELDNLGIRSIVVLPIVIGGSIGMYACFEEKNKERSWQMEELKFLGDSVKILQSILTKRIQKNSLASSYASLETILDNVGSAVYVRDLATGTGLFANRNMRHNFGRELKDGSINGILEQEIKSESGVGEIFLESSERWYELYYTRIKWVDGKPVLLYALYDETEKKIYQRKIEQQASTDFLTGLYNRMCCERDLARYVDEARRTAGKGALLYLDLDDFKHINDGLGHQYGDVLLKAIAHSFQRIKGIEDTSYRMGGDEFVIIVPPGNYDKLDSIVCSIKEIFSRPWFLKDSDYYCTMSMGIVDFPDGGEAVHELIKKADIAMYEAKKGGKNRIAKYSSEIGSKSGRRLDMEKNMREATAKGYQEFEVYFQPIIDVQKNDFPCTGAEALIRWNSTELGFISPAEFIPLAEYLGLINPIGNYVLGEACKCCKYWNDNGYPDYKVNVNLSVVQLLQNDIVEIVEKTIKDTGINAHNLTLEVTESLAINDMEKMKGILERIKSLGVRIALDDFGTGYSSLNHIRELPLDVIKVDQSFIRNLEKDVYAKSFIRMIAELAEAIGVNLCVEGVETKGQFEIVSKMHVSLIQGYYFNKPMKREEFEKKYTPELHKKIKGEKEDEISSAGTV
ncbi:MAG: EAL domain-containing protein [Suilimivivens sp.]